MSQYFSLVSNGAMFATVKMDQVSVFQLGQCGYMGYKQFEAYHCNILSKSYSTDVTNFYSSEEIIV